MKAAINPNNGLCFACQSTGLFIGKTFRMRQPLGKLFVVIELFHVLRRADNHHVLRAVFTRAANFHQLAPVTFRGDFLPVSFQLGISRHVVVIADIESQGFFGRSDFRRSLCCERGTKQNAGKDEG